MYGIVNAAVQSLVVKVAGEKAWSEIVESIGFAGSLTDESENYSDEITINIALAICDYLNMELNDLLQLLGKHWISYTEEQGWHQHFKPSGNNFIEVLEGLDSLHARVKDAMPDGSMPAFAVSSCEQGYKLEYHSTRDIFAPLVLGILNGLAESFDEHWHFEHVGHKKYFGFDTFLLVPAGERLTAKVA